MTDEDPTVLPFPLSDAALDRLADQDLAALTAQVGTMADSDLVHMWYQVHAPDGYFADLRAEESYDPTYFYQVSVLLSDEIAQRKLLDPSPKR